MARKRRIPPSPLSPSTSKPRRDGPGRQTRPVGPPPVRGRRGGVGGSGATPKAEAKADTSDLAASIPLRIGHGWDLHRLEPVAPAGIGRPMVIGGIRPPASSGQGVKGPVARSDGDVLLHAITDAILGALCEPDIGQLFPDTDVAQDGQDSSVYVLEAMRRARALGYELANVDCTIICERPKIGPIKEQIRLNLARLLEIGPDRVNLKGKTHEKVDAVGRGEAIEAHAVVLLVLRKGRG